MIIELVGVTALVGGAGYLAYKKFSKPKAVAAPVSKPVSAPVSSPVAAPAPTAAPVAVAQAGSAVESLNPSVFVVPAGITQAHYKSGFVFLCDYNKANFAADSHEHAFIELNCQAADKTLNSNPTFIYTALDAVKDINGNWSLLGKSVELTAMGYSVKVIPTRYSATEAAALAWINSSTDSDNGSGSGFSPVAK